MGVFANIPAKIITNTWGVVDCCTYVNTNYVNDYGWTYNGTWAAYRTYMGLTGWLYDFTWALAKPNGTYTQTITLKSGNYFTQKVVINGNTTDAEIKFYLVNNTQIYAWNFSVGGSKLGHLVLVLGYRTDNNHLMPVFQYDLTSDVNHVSVDRSNTSVSYSTYIGWLLNSIAPPDPYGLNEPVERPSGYGPFDYTSEDETPPGVPSVSAATVGFVSLWNPTESELKALADWLWTGSFAINTWRAIFSKPMECILSVGIVPITPTRKQYDGADHKYEIEFTGVGTSVNSYKVTEQYYVEDMGSMHISGMSNSAMDYAPYAKASIYLPYCGTYALDIDEIMDADLALEYHIDIYTGACVAYLTIDNRKNSDGSIVHNVMYQFTGNVLATIPVTSADHSQFIQSLLFMGASISATVATSGASGGAAIEGLSASGDVVAGSSALNAVTAGSAINTVMSMKPNVMHSGNLSSTAGLLGGQKPYVTITWSNLCRPSSEYELCGMPLQKSGTLSDFSGFTIVSACHMENILCTEAERALIEQALAKGVII